MRFWSQSMSASNQLRIARDSINMRKYTTNEINVKYDNYRRAVFHFDRSTMASNDMSISVYRGVFGSLARACRRRRMWSHIFLSASSTNSENDQKYIILLCRGIQGDGWREKKNHARHAMSDDMDLVA